jgi:FKBP-type peptidyl-prolyl cis-trans isomerase 2
MYKKRALVLWGYLSLLALAACWPKVIDDSDIVLVDYVYSFADGSVIDQWTMDFTVWENDDSKWIESIVRWAKQDAEFEWKVSWKEIYSSEYDSNNVQSYTKTIMTMVLWIENPTVWTEVEAGSLWVWVITDIQKDSDGYDVYIVDFNDPKTYSELSYSLKVVSIEKD